MIELRNHIAQARHPDTREPLFDADGQPVPLFPDQRSIWLDGVMIGYVCSAPYHRPSFINYAAGADPDIVAKVRELVVEEFGVDPDVVSNVDEQTEGYYEDGN